MAYFSKLAVSGMLLLTTSSLRAQAPVNLPADPTNVKIVPPSPVTWEFAKYGEYPVSKATGVPEISVPLYTVKSGDLTLPITLTYHAGGHKVDTRAPMTGLGWSLNAGGMVCRTMKGIPDEHSNGLVNLDEQLPDSNMFNPEGMLDPYCMKIGTEHDYMILLGMTRGDYDSEPDEFHYNFAGHSGKFFLDPDGKPVTQPYSNIIFEFSAQKITAITPDGTQYKFEDVTHSFAQMGSQLHSFPSTWWLTEILSPTSAHQIRFTYTGAAGAVIPLKIHSEFLTDSDRDGLYTPAPQHYQESNPRWDTERRVETIEFEGGKVKFNAVYNDRLDDPYAPRLTSVEIFNNADPAPVKSFTFQYDYFNRSGETLARRLKLLSVQEHGMNGKSIPPHEFTYLETGDYQLPPRYSFSQDYWGYYNGAGNASLLPRQQIRVSNGLDYFIGHADRTPHAERMKAGIIETITYPTGGKTEFVFEANDITTWTTIQGEAMRLEATAPFSNGPEDIKRISPDDNFEAVLKLNISFYGPAEQQPPAQMAYAEFIDETTGHPFYRGEVGSDRIAIQLLAGHTYKLLARSRTDLLVASVSIEWRKASVPAIKKFTIGGLRIKNIKNFDAAGQKTTERLYEYQDINNPSQSSGNYHLDFLPSPQSFLNKTIYKYTNGHFHQCQIMYDRLYSVTAFPTSELGFNSGDPVTYQYVTEHQIGDKNNGKAIYQYELRQDFTMRTSNGYRPERLTLDRSWLRGQPAREYYYNSSGELIKEVAFTYETINLKSRVRGVKVDKLFEASAAAPGGVCVACTGPADGSTICSLEQIQQARRDQIFLTFYDEPIQWKRLKSITQTVDGVSTTTQHSYDADQNAPHTNVVAVEMTDSEKRIHRTDIRYAKELNEESLKSRNMVAIPVESDVKVNGQLVGGSRVRYNTLYSPLIGFFLPVSFEERLADGSYRLLKEIKSLDDKGNPTMYQTAAGIKTSIIWDTDYSVPIAEITNALPAEIAYTSFENGSGKGGWTFTMSENTENSKTGRKSFSGSSVSTTLPAGNYVVSFWAKRSGASNGTVTVSGVAETQIVSTDEWQLFQFRLNSVTNVSLALSGVLLDELRLQPFMSQMTTFTHEPLVGATSKTDTNNVTTYFNYDEFSRLKSVLDNNRHIVKNYKYHYLVR